MTITDPTTEWASTEASPEDYTELDELLEAERRKRAFAHMMRTEYTAQERIDFFGMH